MSVLKVRIDIREPSCFAAIHVTTRISRYAALCYLLHQALGPRFSAIELVHFVRRQQ